MLLAGVISDMMTDFGEETEGAHKIETRNLFQCENKPCENPTQ